MQQQPSRSEFWLPSELEGMRVPVATVTTYVPAACSSAFLPTAAGVLHARIALHDPGRTMKYWQRQSSRPAPLRLILPKLSVIGDHTKLQRPDTIAMSLPEDTSHKSPTTRRFMHYTRGSKPGCDAAVELRPDQGAFSCEHVGSRLCTGSD